MLAVQERPKVHINTSSLLDSKLPYFSIRECHQPWSTMVNKIDKHVVIRTTVKEE